MERFMNDEDYYDCLQEYKKIQEQEEKEALENK